MKVIITGATGLVGRALVRSLLSKGHEVTRLVRGDSQAFRAPGSSAAHWDPEKGTIDAGALEGHDAAVHLAGESVASGRWNEEKKRRILESRVKGTRLLAEALAGLREKPRVLVSASATGFYGDRGEEILREESASGDDFLAGVCREWEKAALAASQAGIRVVHMRIGIVLAGEGGALEKMLTPFKMGVGGRLGSGRQYMSWIALEDLVGAIEHALADEKVHGPVNAVAPRPVTNEEFTKTLGGVLGRPTIFPVPAFALRLAVGEMAEVLLGGQRVEPARLKESGYQFKHPDLEGALRAALGKS